MRNLSRAALLVAFLHVGAAAEDFSVGAGVSASSTNSKGDALSPRIGGNAGVGFESEISGMLYLAPGLNLETRGERRASSGGDATLKFLYLQAPIHLLLRVPVGGVVFDLFAGPSLGFNVLAELESRYATETRTENIRDEINIMDAGFDAGVGLEIPAGAGHLFLRSSFYAGWTSPFVESPETKWRAFQFKAGWRFPIGISPAGASPEP